MNYTVNQNIIWFEACKVKDVPENGGVCVKFKDEQVALYHFKRRGEWYATQNLCPHKKQMALSRGIIGSFEGTPKVACPFHKKSFSLVDGSCINDEEELHIKVYKVKVENENVFIGFSDGDDVETAYA